MTRILLATVIGLSTGTARAAEPAAIHLSVLTVGSRASLVLEAAEPIARAAQTGADATTVTVDVGPIRGEVVAQNLTSAPDIPLIAGATIRAIRDAAGQSLVRVVVRLRAAAHATVRTAGTRVYVDISPMTATPSPAVTPPVAPAPAAAAPQPPALTYSALEADTRRRALKLAAVPDVKGLLALRAEVVKSDKQLGGKQPEVIGRLLEEVDRYTDEARELRLKMDAALAASRPKGY